MIEIEKEPHYVLTFRQRLFVRYFMAILIDLVVLNLFVEYWDKVIIDSFTISILAAILLQVLLRGTMLIEDRIGNYFKKNPGKGAMAKRVFLTWLVLFSSKFVILGAIDWVFGDRVDFGGIISFFVVVFTVLGIEYAVTRIVYAGWMRSQLKAEQPPSE